MRLLQPISVRIQPSTVGCSPNEYPYPQKLSKMRRVIELGGIIAVLLQALVQAELEVTQVQVLFRHGDRTPNPSDLYPNDIYNISVYQPWGLGQLINIGKMREYKIGQLLKTRYRELLGPLYIPNAVYATSTDTDRTKMSLQLVLAGLFPPSQVQAWNPDLPWMPIPTHYVPLALDNLMHSLFCPEFEKALEEVMKLPEVQAKIAVYNDLFDLLTVETGLNVTEPISVYLVYHCLVAQKAMNLPWPQWCTDDVFRQITEATTLQYELWTYTTDIKRIHGGPMVRRFIENMHLNRTKENPRKLYLFSAHERTLSAYLRAQGVTEPKVPLFGSAVMIEKLEDDDGGVYVRLVLWTGVTEQLITLQVPGCEEVCPIEMYQELTREVIPSDEELNCNWNRLSVDELRTVFDESISE